MKRLAIILVGALVVLLVLSFAKDLIVKASVEKGTELVTGLKLSIGSFRVGLINTLVDIKNLRLFNPAGFKDRTMIDMPEIYVDYDLGAILGGKIHLTKVRLNCREFVVVKNEKGELNLNSLKVVQAQKEGKKPAEKAVGKAPQIQVDSLELKIGKVTYKDYSKGPTPSVREFNINIDEKYSNITDPYAVVSLIVVKSMMNTSIPSLTNFNLRGMEGTISGTLGTAQKVAAEAVTRAHESLRQVTGSMGAGGVTGQTNETVQKTTEALSGILKNPFGSKE